MTFALDVLSGQKENNDTAMQLLNQTALSTTCRELNDAGFWNNLPNVSIETKNKVTAQILEIFAKQHGVEIGTSKKSVDLEKRIEEILKSAGIILSSDKIADLHIQVTTDGGVLFFEKRNELIIDRINKEIKAMPQTSPQKIMDTVGDLLSEVVKGSEVVGDLRAKRENSDKGQEVVAEQIRLLTGMSKGLSDTQKADMLAAAAECGFSTKAIIAMSKEIKQNDEGAQNAALTVIHDGIRRGMINSYKELEEYKLKNPDAEIKRTNLYGRFSNQYGRGTAEEAVGLLESENKYPKLVDSLTAHAIAAAELYAGIFQNVTPKRTNK